MIGKFANWLFDSTVIAVSDVWRRVRRLRNQLAASDVHARSYLAMQPIECTCDDNTCSLRAEDICDEADDAEFAGPLGEYPELGLFPSGQPTDLPPQK